MQKTRRLGCIVWAVLFFSALGGMGFPVRAQETPPFVELEKKRAAAILGALHGTTPNQRSYDVVYYGLDLTLEIGSRQIYGLVNVRVKVKQGPLDALELHADTNLKIDSALVDGRWIVPWRKQDSISVVVIDFPDGARMAGDTLSVTVAYHGRPRSTGFGPFGFDTFNGRPMVWSLSEPFGAHYWWPCKDDPSDKADSADIRIRVPSGLIAVSNGKLRQVTETDGWTTYWWHEKYPIATYLISVAVHNYVLFSDTVQVVPNIKTPVEYYVFPEDLERAEMRYGVTPAMIEVFSQLFGPYPFYEEKYGHAQFLGPANMEHQTISSLRSFSEGIIAHELAHQWWGDMITCASFEHIWLNEGFASYAQALWKEARYGKEAYHNLMQHFVYLGEGTVYVPPQEVRSGNVSRIFDYNLSYRKGAYVLHMLRHVLGDSVFFEAIRAYGNDPTLKYGVATTEDFQRVCEAVSGMDLNFFFQQWIYGEGYPQYAFRMESEASGRAAEVRVIVEQKQPWQVFQMPLDLLFRFADRDSLIRVWNDQRRQEYLFRFSQPPVSVELDPENWILKEAWQLGTGVSGPRLPRNMQLVRHYPNPFHQGCWFWINVPAKEKVSLQIFDVLGRQIITLIDAELRTGIYPLYWDGTDRRGRSVPPGIYFVRLQSGRDVRSFKIARMRR